MGIWLQMGFTLVAICTPALMLFDWFVGIELRAVTDEKEIVRLGVRFARILLFSIWPNAANAFLRLYFQAVGVMIPTIVVGVITIMVSIAANYFLFTVHSVAWAWGLTGATVVASWFQPIALTWYCVVYKKFYLRVWNQWDFNETTRERMIIFYNNSATTAVNSLMTDAAASVLFLIAAQIIAANAIVSGFWRLLWALFWGFGMGTLSLSWHCSRWVLLFFVRLYSDCTRPTKTCLTYARQNCQFLGQVHIHAWTSAIASWLFELPTAYIFAVALKMARIAVKKWKWRMTTKGRGWQCGIQFFL
ncbi:putative multi antimicrobial extrusion protein [Plasmopara halstedii]